MSSVSINVLSQDPELSSVFEFLRTINEQTPDLIDIDNFIENLSVMNESDTEAYTRSINTIVEEARTATYTICRIISHLEMLKSLNSLYH